MPMQYSNGLTLIPREVNSMIAEMKSVIEAYNSELEDATHPIVSYAFENGLEGKAYTNSKHHMEDHLTVIRGAVAANKKFESCLDKLSAIVGGERLVEEELRETIKNCNSKIADYRKQKSYYRNKLYDPTYDLYCGDYARRRIRHCADSIDRLTAIKQRAEEKIKRLYEINGESAKCFDSISNSYIAVVQGINSLNAGRALKGFAPRINAEWRTCLQASINNDYFSEILEQFRELNIELTDEEIRLIKKTTLDLPATGETFAELTSALMVIRNAVRSGAEITRKNGYIIIKGAPWLRDAIPLLSKVKGNKYLKGSDAFIDANLQYWIPKSERTFFNLASKTVKNFPEAWNIHFEGGFKQFMKDAFLPSRTKTLDPRMASIEKVGNVGKALGYLSVGVDVAKGVYNNYASGEKEATKYAADVAVDIAAGLGEMAAATACAKAGAAIGTAIPIPVVGTVVGAAVGFAAGYAVSLAFNSKVGTAVKDVAKQETKKIFDTISSTMNSAFESIGGCSKAIGTAVAAWG